MVNSWGSSFLLLNSLAYNLVKFFKAFFSSSCNKSKSGERMKERKNNNNNKMKKRSNLKENIFLCFKKRKKKNAIIIKVWPRVRGYENKMLLPLLFLFYSFLLPHIYLYLMYYIHLDLKKISLFIYFYKHDRLNYFTLFYQIKFG